MREELSEIARRVAGRVLAERGLGADPAHRAPGGGAPAGGAHVDARPGGEPLRPRAPEGAPPPASRGPELVTARDVVVAAASGSALSAAAEARLTPLAREEAWSRGMRVESGVHGGRRLVVAVASDHGGFALKGAVLEWLRALGHQAVDLGTHDERAVDYPDFAAAVAEQVADGRADLGVVVDAAGIGSAIAANKVPGARAACCGDEAAARNAREHNFANVLTLGGRVLTEAQAERVLRAFLATPEGAERHARRVAKIAALEARHARRALPVRRVLRAPAEGGA